MSNAERTVAIGGVSREQAIAQVTGDNPVYDAESLPNAIPEFTSVKYESFTAEWGKVGDDVQIKFYLPKHAKLETPEARKAWMDYWLNRFPLKLDPVAREYFEAEYPRLVVKWTEELQSWWFRGGGYGRLLDVEGYLRGFFEKLNEALLQKEE